MSSKEIEILVCSGNLANTCPDQKSLEAWIPHDGRCRDVFRYDDIHLPPDDNDKDKLHKSHYPIRLNAFCQPETPYHIDDFSEDDRFSIIVIGMQEATWDLACNTRNSAPALLQSKPNGDSKNERAVGAETLSDQEPDFIIDEPSSSDVLYVAPKEKLYEAQTLVVLLNKLNPLTAARQSQAKKRGKPSILVSESTPLETSAAGPDYTVVGNFQHYASPALGLLASPYITKMLHAMLSERLPSYKHLVSYQRGQMRLEIFVLQRGKKDTDEQGFEKDDSSSVDVQVLHVAAQNTGRAGLPNKGGIVAELLVNQCTRFSFCTAHLEAHEGPAKYKIRCSTIADILAGTRHDVHDVSVSTHYCFFLGDLNFRTELPADEVTSDDDHRQKVRALVKEKNWEILNKYDELDCALKKGDCLVGFKTLYCNFPPTFKVERSDGYEYVDKRRPSYTDRVVWKTAHGLETGIKPLLYEPITIFSTSDHKPVRAAFKVSLNPELQIRPRLSRRHVAQQSTTLFRSLTFNIEHGLNGANQPREPTLRTNRSPMYSSPSTAISAEKLHLFISQIRCTVVSRSSSPPSPYVALVSYPEEALKTASSWWLKMTRNIPLLTKPTTSLKSVDGTSRKLALGFPRSTIKKATFEPQWGNEEIHCVVQTHDCYGKPLNLAGALLAITVMDNSKTDDCVIGTFCFNLVDMLHECYHMFQESRRQQQERQIASEHASRSSLHSSSRRDSLVGFLQKSFVGRSSTFTNTAGDIEDNTDFDPIVSTDIDEPLVKNGRQVGRIQCGIEMWYMLDDSSRKVGSVTDRVAKKSRKSSTSGIAKNRNSSSHTYANPHMDEGTWSARRPLKQNGRKAASRKADR